MSNRLIQIAITCIGAALLASCAGPVYKLYEGPNLQPNEIAVLKNSPGWSGLSVYVDSIDGITRSNDEFYGSMWDGSFRVELLPGEHTVSVRYTSDYYSVQNKDITFHAEAGKIYTVKASIDSAAMKWTAWVEEIDDNVK